MHACASGRRPPRFGCEGPVMACYLILSIAHLVCDPDVCAVVCESHGPRAGFECAPCLVHRSHAASSDCHSAGLLPKRCCRQRPLLPAAGKSAGTNAAAGSIRPAVAGVRRHRARDSALCGEGNDFKCCRERQPDQFLRRARHHDPRRESERESVERI